MSEASVNELYRRYKSGELNPDQKKQYEDAISSGKVPLPEKGSLDEDAFIKSFEGLKPTAGGETSNPKKTPNFNWDAVEESLNNDIAKNNASNDSAIDLATKTDSRAYAEIKTLSKQTGIPEDVVERNRDDIERTQKSERVKTLLQYAPILADKFKEPEFAKLAHSDADNLAALEQSLKSLGPVSKNIHETVRELTPSDVKKAQSDVKAILQGKEAPLPSHEFAPRKLPEAELPKYPGYGFGLGEMYVSPPSLGEWATGVKKSAIPLFKQTKAAIDIALSEQTIGAPEVPGMMVGLPGMDFPEQHPEVVKAAQEKATAEPIRNYIQATKYLEKIKPEGMTETQQLFYETAQAGIKMAPSLAVTAITKNPWAFAAIYYPDVYSNQYAQLTTRFPDMSPEEKNLHSNVSAGIEILTEKIPMEQVINFGKPFFNRLVATMFAEGGQEASSQLLQDLYAKATYDPKITLAEALKDAGHSAIVGGLLGGGMTVSTVPVAIAESQYNKYVTKYKKESTKAEKAIKDSASLSENVDIANSSELRQHSPEVFKEFIENNLGAENNVYIAPEDAAGFFQSKPELIAKLEEQAPDTAASIMESLDAGSDVVIPKSDLLTYFPEYYSELANIVRNDQDGFTVQEAEAFQQESPQAFEKEAKAALEEDQKQAATEASANKVARNIAEQIINTGKFSPDVAAPLSLLHKAFAKSVAERKGILPEQVYQQFPLKVEGEGGVQIPSKTLTQEDVATTLGIEVSEVTPEDYQRAIRSQLQARKDVLPTVGGGRAKQGWASATRISRKDGEPITVYRGSATSLSPGSFSTERLGGASKNPSSGLGVWFTPHEGEASTYGKAEAFHLDIRNPKVIKVEDLPGFDSVQDATKFREDLRKQGYDGIAIDARHLKGPIHFVAFDAEQVIHPEKKGYAQAPVNTQTDAFKKWFGDSKVVDKWGNPLIVYHGTGGDIQSFDFNKLGEASQHPVSHLGVFFGEVADEQYTVDKENANVIPAYLSLQNPYEIQADDFVKLLEFHKPDIDKAIEDFESANDGAEILLRSDGVSVIFQGDEINDITELPNDIEENFYNFLDIYEKFINYDYRDEFDNKETINEIKKIKTKLLVDGYDGIIINPDGLQGDSWTELLYKNYISFKPEQIKSIFNTGEFDPGNQNILAQQERGLFIPETNTIKLLENADLSTFIHESGHFFLEAMNAVPEMNQEMDVIFNWFGTNREAWNQMSLDEKRDHHEKFARGFEAYLFEGKAPNEDLRSAFRRFRDWLVSVYKSIRNLNVKLTPEVRQVFDRMLSTDEQIRRAEVADAYAPIFKSIEESGMTQQQWDDYQKLNEERRDKSREDLETRSIKDMKWMSNAKARTLRAMQREVNAKRKAIREEVSAQIDLEKVYVAQDFFRKGLILDEKGDIQKVENHRLDIDALNAMFPYGAEFDIPDWRKLGHGKYGMIGKDGLDPTDVAHQLGYSSADQMIRDILESPPKKEYIDAVTDQVMLERYGDITDPIKMERAAEEAVHNQVHTRFLHTELTALTKGVGNKNILSKAARDYAQQSISDKKIRNIKPNQYLLSQSRSAEQALKALSKGEREQAIDHKRAQVLNNYLYREAIKAQKEVEKALRYVKKFTKDGTRKNIDNEYLEQIDDLLGTFEFKEVSAKALEKRQSLADFIQKQEEAGFEPIIDETLVNETKRKNYKELTLGELRGHIDSIKNIEHLGRLKNKLLTARDQRDFQRRVDEAKLSIELNSNRKAKVRASPNDVLGEAGRFWRSGIAAHRKFASIVREMDGGQDNGVMWNLLSRSMNESGDNEVAMRAEATADLAKLFNQVKLRTGVGNIRAPKYLIPGTDFSLTDEQRIMVAMNWGNEGNRQRLMDGGIAGKEKLTDTEVQSILDTLTQKEWGLVQSVWDFLETYRDRIGEQEQRLTGKTPKWVEPTPIVTKFGTLRGGYFPAKYDTLLSTRSDQLEAATDLRMGMKGVFGASATRSGYAKERANQVKGRPLLLSFNAITTHTNEVIHRLAWQDYLTDANRVMKAIDGTVRNKYGVEILEEMQETLKDIAQGEAPARNPLEKAINYMRIGSTITGMGWRLTTALIQPTGLAQSWVRVGGRHISHGLHKSIKNPLQASREANEKSKFMRDRDRTQQREISEVLNTLRVGDKYAKFKASYFYLIQKMQRTVDVPTWWGAYDKALEQLQIETAVDAEQRKAIEEKAVALADQAVLDSQSGGQLKDLARIQRGGPFQKLWTNFYSYFSATYNLNVEAFRKMDIKNNPASALTFLGDMVVLNIMPVLMSVALKEMFRGDCGDDMECLAGKLKDEQVSYLFGQLVLLREVSAGAQVVAGGKSYGYTGPAGLRPLADIYKMSVQAAQGEIDEGFRKAALQLTGDLLHLPTGQVNTMIDGFTAVENGEVTGARAVLAPLAGAPAK